MSEPKAVNVPYSRYSRDDKKPFRQFYNMTPAIKSQVCVCLTIDITQWKWRNFVKWEKGMANTDYHILLCNVCRKPDSFNLHRCIDCGEIFVKDFYATFCYDMPRCWDCTQEFPTGCYNLSGTCIEADQSKWVAPMLPKPKIFAADDLNDFASSLGI